MSTIKTALETLLQRSPEDKEEDNDSDAGDDVDEKGSDDLIDRPPGVNDGEFYLFISTGESALMPAPNVQRIGNFTPLFLTFRLTSGRSSSRFLPKEPFRTFCSYRSALYLDYILLILMTAEQ